MKKSIIFLACIVLACPSLFAQKDYQITLFPWASLNYNPGAAGEQNNTLCFTAFFRQQYLGIKEPAQSDESVTTENYNDISSRNMAFNVEFYSRKIRGAFALSIDNDKAAYYNNINLKLGYAFKLNLGPGKLGIGAQVVMINQSLDVSKLHATVQDDPLLKEYNESEMNMDFNFGLYYKAERWFAGVSILRMLDNSAFVLSGQGFQRPPRTLYATGGYIWTLPWNPSWNIEPSAIIRTDLAMMNFDLMAIARYNSVVWGGLSYRLDDAVSILMGARPFHNSSNNFLKGLEAGLAYSITTTKIGYRPKGSFGDIEILIRYCFDLYKQEVFSGYGSSRSIYKNQY
ncbi:MAG: PorP/SprF family type IX secretion system membrane protein [Bacteroidales bacterium]|nr:PorP/SprF family type IX secretion system membrane protein [Bacteroidales bacterium]